MTIPVCDLPLSNLDVIILFENSDTGKYTFLDIGKKNYFIFRLCWWGELLNNLQV